MTTSLHRLQLTDASLWYCRYQGHVSAALVLGGVDLNGPHLLTVCGTCLLYTVSLLMQLQPGRRSCSIWRGALVSCSSRVVALRCF